MKEEAENWWAQALEDLDTAKVNLENEKYYAASLFAQQSVEKALKAYYIDKYEKLMKTHDLVYLANKLDLPENLVELCAFSAARLPRGY